MLPEGVESPEKAGGRAEGKTGLEAKERAGGRTEAPGDLGA